MVFIVEMGWGRPPATIVEDFDEDGTRVIAEIIPSSDPPDPEYRFFSCNGFVWREALQVARASGWQPMGTQPAPGSRWGDEYPFDARYQPEEWGFAKMMSGPDAAALADALGTFLEGGKALPVSARAPIIIREGMMADELRAANRSLSPGFLQEFIAFLRKGPFRFAWDD